MNWFVDFGVSLISAKKHSDIRSLRYLFTCRHTRKLREISKCMLRMIFVSICKDILILLFGTYPNPHTNGFNAILACYSWWIRACRISNLRYSLILILPRLLQRSKDAAVFILRYTTLSHSWLWDMIHTSPFGTMWNIPCVWNPKSFQLHADFTFST